jgi:hypothetical protein
MEWRMAVITTMICLARRRIVADAVWFLANALACTES